MSSRNYTITIQVKDGGILKRLDQLQNGGSGGGNGTGGSKDIFKVLSGHTPIFDKIRSLGIGQLLKLSGIGFGVGALVTATIKSSGQLQGLMKLWETMAMLVFRPFGDFVAMALRPLTLALLRDFIVPWVRFAVPFFRDTGRILGDVLLKLYEFLFGKPADITGVSAPSGVPGYAGPKVLPPGFTQQDVQTSIGSLVSRGHATLAPFGASGVDIPTPGGGGGTYASSFVAQGQHILDNLSGAATQSNNWLKQAERISNNLVDAGNKIAAATRALHGESYIPGYVGATNIEAYRRNKTYAIADVVTD